MNTHTHIRGADTSHIHIREAETTRIHIQGGGHKPYPGVEHTSGG